MLERPLRQRESRFESRKLLDTAQGQACQYCGSEGTTVPAHCNELEFKGMGRKSDDCLTAWLCFDCHNRHEGRAGNLTRDERQEIFDTAFKRTVRQWFRQNLVKVS
jgi:hypothetical protein